MDDVEKAILIAIIVVIFAVVIYFEWRFMRSRGIGKKIAESASKKDKAFNALLTTKAVRNKLRSQNYDTLKADYIIQKAQDANDSGDYDSCIESCARAREELMRSKQEGNLLSGSSNSMNSILNVAAEDEPESGRARKLKMPSRPKEDPSLPARFELRTAKDDLDSFTGPSHIRESAAALIGEAEKHLEAKDYAKALSCSFKAKKMLSGESEKEEKTDSLERIPIPSPAKESPRPAEQVGIGQLKCPSCGYQVEQGDVFCGQCGMPVSEKKCPSCDAKLKPSDKFCRKCGTKI
ncbi:MAG: zinc ribbon domain-containing protein [Thermoplasmata archaeon]